VASGRTSASPSSFKCLVISASVVYCDSFCLVYCNAGGSELPLAIASAMSSCAVTGVGSRHVSASMPTRAVPGTEMATPPLPCPLAFAFPFALAFSFAFVSLGEPSLSVTLLE
jgi:hypothetical protein